VGKAFGRSPSKDKGDDRLFFHRLDGRLQPARFACLERRLAGKKKKKGTNYE
jgi:hypothetical protein